MDQTSSASKPGTSKQPENLDPTPPRTQSSSRADEAMDVDLHGPSLPPHLRGKQSIQDSDMRHHLGDQQPMLESDRRPVSDKHSGQSEEPSLVVSARPKNMQIKGNTRSGPGTRHHPQGKISPPVLHIWALYKCIVYSKLYVYILPYKVTVLLIVVL